MNINPLLKKIHSDSEKINVLVGETIELQNKIKLISNIKWFNFIKKYHAQKFYKTLALSSKKLNTLLEEQNFLISQIKMNILLKEQNNEC
jgi:hypothetical protein